MNLFDMKTVVFSYAISNAICAVVITFLWLRNRRRFAGLGFWLADFIMQFALIVLIILRGAVPDFVSMVVSNSLVILGTILLYMGLERFTEKRGPQIHNAILLAVFILVQTYFVVMQPSLAARNINISLGLLVICLQCVWLMFFRADVGMRPITRSVGLVLAAFCLVSLTRIMVDAAVPPENDFFHANTFETLLLLTYQMLFILLTFGLALMVNHRLLADLTRDIAMRQQAEDALRQSEEKFFKAFHASPTAILISRITDGWFIEVNDGFCHLSEYSREEALTSSTIALSIWANPQDRERCIAALRDNHSVRDYEYDFRTKSGKILHCLYSGEIIRLGDEAHILSVVSDITDRKQAEAQVAQLASFPQLNPNPVLEVDMTGAVIFYNPAALAVLQRLGLPADACAFVPPDIGAILRALAQGEHPWLEREIELNHAVWNEYIHLTPEFQTARIYATDITARKQTEEVLRLRLRLFEFAATRSLEELMQKALDEIDAITNSPIGFYHFVEEDQKTLSLQAWSTRTRQEFCHAEGEGMHYDLDKAGVWVDCVHQRKPVMHNNYAALPHRRGLPAGHAEVLRELVVPTMRKGLIVSILGVGNKPTDYDEQDVELVAYIADVIWEIVERKRAEAQLQEYQRWLEMQNTELRKLSLAIEQSGSTIVITDTKGTIQYANPRFEQTSGYTVHEALGHNPRLLKSGKQSADYYQYLWQTITSGQIWYGELHNRRKDGSLYWEQVTIAPVHNDAGQITNYIAIKDDITARKQAEEALHERTIELEQRNEELQTALNTIKTLSGMVPICAWCGRKIQDDNGEWVKVETYIQGHTEAEFTHGICPDCKQKSLNEVANLRQTRGQ
jgi:PAS domain S-box-containing protein